ncbi:MAG: hypothetical protein H6Q33_3630, partial [Deltaproteobacteria bacterium]|nr:hypothetical protein [Deltaproteobacteria bacterium]
MREPDAERGAASRSGIDANGTAQHFEDPSHDEEPEAGAAVAGSLCRTRLPKRLKNLLDHRGAHAGAGVGDGDFNAAATAPDRDRDTTTCG